MEFYNMFRQPYLDGDDGVNLGGGGTPADTTQQTDTQLTDTTGQTGQQQTTTEQPKFKVKYNHEEKELGYDEAVPLIQKGMNYDKIYPEYEKLRNNPTLSYLEQKAQKLGITVDQLIENDRKYEEQQEVQQYAEREKISYETAERLLKLEQREAEREKRDGEAEAEKAKNEANKKAESEHSAKIQRECAEFGKLFKEENGRSFDWESDKFPTEVENFVKQGYPLDYAYSRYLVGAKRVSQQTAQANQTNAATSTGSAKANGKVGEFFSQEQVEKMTTAEVSKHLKAIQESRKHW